MERRTALAFAAAAAGTVLTAGAAFTTNVGLLQRDDPTPISVLDSSPLAPDSPQDPTVVTVVVDDPAVPGSSPAATHPSTAASTSDTTSADQSSDDRESDDESVEGSDDRGHEDEHQVEVVSDDDD